MTDSRRLTLGAPLLRDFLREHPRASSEEFEQWVSLHPVQEVSLRQRWAAVRRVAELVDLPLLEIEEGLEISGAFAVGREGLIQPEPLLPIALHLRELPAAVDTSKRYRLEGEVGRGGMGAILRAWDRSLRRTTAMKISSITTNETSYGPQDPKTTALERFLEEAQVTGQLDHPGIVPVHELGIDTEGHIFFTMRLVRGRNLRDVFSLVEKREEDWDRTRALLVLLKVCETMAYAHSRGVIHRDLKPANVMVGRFGEVYVMDWGLAKVQGRRDLRDLRPRGQEEGERTEISRHDSDPTLSSALVTADGTVLGTPAYMPPEQARAELELIDERADIYAVGAMLYHLLAGHPPYAVPGMRYSAHSVLAKVVLGSPSPIPVETRDVPVELESICNKAMRREREMRYSGMRELADDLNAYLSGHVVRAHEVGAWAEAKKWVQRNRRLATALAAIACLLAFLGGAIVFLRGQQAEVGRQREARQGTATVLTHLGEWDRLHQLSQDLWPIHPRALPAMLQWIQDAEILASTRAGHQETLERMRAELALAPVSSRGAENQELSAQSLAQAAPQSFRFADLEVQRDHDALAELVRSLDELQSKDPRVTSLANMRDRLGRLRMAGEDSLESSAAQAAWAEAIVSIADPDQCPAYKGMHIQPQFGLLPIWRNPQTTLWEFAHLLSGEAAVPGPSGDLELEDSSGIVLVLMPAGEAWIGTQLHDQAQQNYSRQSAGVSTPSRHTFPHFFVSKFELTQSQWIQLTGTNPSCYSPTNVYHERGSDLDPLGLRHPVEMISWIDCQEIERKFSLRLPTGAEWEYCARGGSTFAFSTGDDEESLIGYANFSDAFLARLLLKVTPSSEFKDQHTNTAPVGSYLPNPYGLYDIYGNVFELCQDAHPEFLHETDEAGGHPWRTKRGGSYESAPVHVSLEVPFSREQTLAETGFRPVLAVDGTTE